MTYDNIDGPIYSTLYGKGCGDCTWTVVFSCIGLYWNLTSFGCSGTCGCGGPTSPPVNEGQSENTTCL
jgi:hypothetical protein